ncbi:MAG: PDZ domain-containing protein [Bacilli bacterium]|nr:PDZ domain-containing protein [Bacilli bacterium]
MFINFYEKIKEFIKKYYKNIIFFVILYILFMWPLDYYIITGGGIMEVGDRIEVEEEISSKGDFNLAYVSESRATIATYVLSYVIPDWERLKISTYTYDSEEDAKDVNFRSNIDLLNAHDHAIKNAYLKANKSYQVVKTELYVYYIDKDTKNSLKVGDKILEVDGNEVNDLDNFKSILSTYQENDQIQLLVERNHKKKKIDATLYKKDDKLILGIYVNAIRTYKTNPAIKIKFKKTESGPSGGIIETLDIYNKLIKEDITKGLKIAGTGEIDSEGNVLTIGGVKHKLLGAEKENADIFIVPKGENYQECKRLKKKKKLKIKVIGVATFDEALEKLERLKK